MGDLIRFHSRPPDKTETIVKALSDLSEPHAPTVRAKDLNATSLSGANGAAQKND